MTMEIFMRTLLDGSVSPTISQQELEDATMRVITLLGKVILKFPDNIDSTDELDVESHVELRAYAQLFQQHATCDTRHRAVRYDDHFRWLRADG
jgi:hypothetical protein